VPEIRIVSVTRTRDEGTVAPVEAAATEGAEDEFGVDLSGDLPAGDMRTPATHLFFGIQPKLRRRLGRFVGCSRVLPSHLPFNGVDQLIRHLSQSLEVRAATR
jgi:hypothetical protein